MIQLYTSSTCGACKAIDYTALKRAFPSVQIMQDSNDIPSDVSYTPTLILDDGNSRKLINDVATINNITNQIVNDSQSGTTTTRSTGADRKKIDPPAIMTDDRPYGLYLFLAYLGSRLLK